MIEVPRRIAGAESSRKVLRMLLAFSESRPSASADELAGLVGVPLSTAYRYIALLREVGLVQDGPNNTYRLSARVIPLARAARAANSLIDLGEPLLERLVSQCNEAALLIQRVDRSAVCVARAEPDHAVRLSFDIGRPMPLHGGAAAKVLLAAMTPAARKAYLDDAAAVDPRLRPQRAALERSLAAVRQHGWAESVGEVDRGIWAVAAPVHDHSRIVAALTVAGFAERIDRPTAQQIRDLVRATAAELSAALGGAP